jgi:hypothetical protein
MTKVLPIQQSARICWPGARHCTRTISIRKSGALSRAKGRPVLRPTISVEPILEPIDRRLGTFR